MLRSSDLGIIATGTPGLTDIDTFSPSTDVEPTMEVPLVADDVKEALKEWMDAKQQSV